MKKFLCICALVFCWNGFFSAPGAFADSHHKESPSFSVVDLRANFHFLQGKGGNILLSTGPEGSLIIDNDYTEMYPALAAALKPFGGTDKVRYVIDTHWHTDHTGNNVPLGGHALIISHDNVRKRLASPQDVKLLHLHAEALPKEGLPEITYSRSLRVHFNDHEFILTHFAHSHTDGDTVIRIPGANIIHTGDLFFNNMFPFIDLETGGNALNYLKSVEEILAQSTDDSIIIPGHGALASKADLARFAEMLRGTFDEVRALKAQGLSQELAQQHGLSEKWEKWGQGFIKEPVWIGIVYKSLSATS
ncbi:MAG: MBL fold metallo-hydrolase [Bdellovibrionales bacterium]|nr:MBL fold metallo-hydrolase [Bdellovibrionales bacterium]